MAQIAIAAGVPQDDLSVEAQSRDMIGNVWFTKPLLHQHGYVVAIRGEQSTRPPEEIAIWEAGLLAVSRHWFATIQPGDDAAIAAVLAREHPIYPDHPQTTLAQLADMITQPPA